MGIRRVLKEQQGWTLVELSLTLAMIGLLAILALPAFVQWGDRLDRELFLGGLAADLRFAQTQARLTEEETLLVLDASKHRYTVKQGDHLLRNEKIPSRFQLTSNYPRSRVIFRRSGQVRGGTFVLYTRGKRVGRVVVQVASGRPRVEVDP
ncbi:prepilin-type N-terminal cleavage/methylation domain-containing protein [Marininema mesophilum]|uniref:Prepilin-type N-terminal cleavage/methylation domain-containing protein n=1 Tax=Marininema mesophilum TaxID=1048340 RepID=A0A1H2QPZ5_9BACL|nr:GspH/FimT family pseudopilin [Marininema mesophilum]SDW09201.1 prepilin-type N-terminal cleavage/methylation domain-containing protein [Marininema mesophilum]